MLALTLAACQGDAGKKDDGDKVSGDVKRGGTLRLAADHIPYTGAMDPQAEYLGDAWGIFSQALMRGLVTYKHVAGAEGNEVVPDVAEAMPEVSDDGLVYTFKLKKGVKWSPPLNRDVVAKDFVNALERTATKGLAAYGNYYGTPPNKEVIKGLHDFYNGDADTISGVEAVDDYTVRITLTEPFDNLLYVLAMPASRALPREVSRCFPENGTMGRFLLSNGPYMFEGTEALKVDGSCKAMKDAPIKGFNPTGGFTLVRNPNYDAATDSPDIRPAYVEKITAEIVKNATTLFDRIEKNEIDATWITPPVQYVKKFSEDTALSKRMHSNPGDRTWFLVMNLTEPPFDDVNVRRAVNWAMDKSALVSKWGGAKAGNIATHILPPLMLDNKLGQDYDPFKTEGFRGDIEKAKAAMRESKYDTDKDGICDAPHCKKVLFINRDTPPHVDMTPVVEEALKAIGIETVTRETPDHYTQVGDASTHFGIAANAGWGKDYADAVTYAILFDGRTLTDAPKNEAAVGNYAYVGLTEDLAKKIGITYPEGGVPNLDADIDRCVPLLGDERTQCWVDLDKKIMEEVVPWVPYLWGNNINIISEAVTKYEFDQFSTDMSFVHMAVDPAKQR